jgi:hypothetical protein
MDMGHTPWEPLLDLTESVLLQEPNGLLAVDVPPLPALNLLLMLAVNGSLAQLLPTDSPQTAPRLQLLSPTPGEVVKDPPGTTLSSTVGALLALSLFSPKETLDLPAEVPTPQLITPTLLLSVPPPALTESPVSPPVDHLSEVP